MLCFQNLKLLPERKAWIHKEQPGEEHMCTVTPQLKTSSPLSDAKTITPARAVGDAESQTRTGTDGICGPVRRLPPVLVIGTKPGVTGRGSGGEPGLLEMAAGMCRVVSKGWS